MVAGRLNDLNDINNFEIEVSAQGVSKTSVDPVRKYITPVLSENRKLCAKWWLDGLSIK